jgi:hypothetical protein
MRLLVVVVAGLCGCDAVFGLSGGELAPCGDEAFGSAKPTNITAADTFSISWDRDRIVFTNAVAYEMALPGGKPVPIDLGPYTAAQLSLTPEGDAAFITGMVEPPPLLDAAVRSGTGKWAPDAIVPRVGTFAGTPTAAEFGPRRVLVRLRFGEPEVQEYEDVDGTWQAIGETHPIGGTPAPNLTPAGFDMVYYDPAATPPGVYIAHRASTAEWFGPPTAILEGDHRFPQLLARCRALYVLDQPTSTATVTEYAR